MIDQMEPFGGICTDKACPEGEGYLGSPHYRDEHRTKKKVEPEFDEAGYRNPAYVPLYCYWCSNDGHTFNSCPDRTSRYEPS